MRIARKPGGRGPELALLGHLVRAVLVSAGRRPDARDHRCRPEKRRHADGERDRGIGDRDENASDRRTDERHNALDRARRGVRRGQLGRSPGKRGEQRCLGRAKRGRDDGRDARSDEDHGHGRVRERCDGRHRGGGGPAEIRRDHHPDAVVPVPEDSRERRGDGRGELPDDREDRDARGTGRAERDDGERDRRRPQAELGSRERELKPAEVAVPEDVPERRPRFRKAGSRCRHGGSIPSGRDELKPRCGYDPARGGCRAR